LQTFIDEGIPPKQMAAWTGYSYQQTWKYANGECNVPTEFINALFRATHDLRLIDLITSGANVAVHEIEPVDLGDVEMIKTLLAQRQQELDRERHLLDALADGRIDPRDREAVEQYNRAFWAANKIDFAIHHAINELLGGSTSSPKPKVQGPKPIQVQSPKSAFGSRLSALAPEPKAQSLGPILGGTTR
jgi:hypothetical protein